MTHRSEEVASIARALSYAGGLLGDLKVALRSLARNPSLWAPRPHASVGHWHEHRYFQRCARRAAEAADESR